MNEQNRGATIYAEFLGGSFTCDAYHMTEPHPQGKHLVFISLQLISEMKRSEDCSKVME